MYKDNVIRRETARLFGGFLPKRDVNCPSDSQLAGVAGELLSQSQSGNLPLQSLGKLLEFACANAKYEYSLALHNESVTQLLSGRERRALPPEVDIFDYCYSKFYGTEYALKKVREWQKNGVQGDPSEIGFVVDTATRIIDFVGTHQTSELSDNVKEFREKAGKILTNQVTGK